MFSPERRRLRGLPLLTRPLQTRCSQTFSAARFFHSAISGSDSPNSRSAAVSLSLSCSSRNWDKLSAPAAASPKGL